jgi:hypothetical protein
MRRTSLLVLTLTGVLLALAALGWARDDKMYPASITPGATGVVKTDNSQNGNTGVEVDVKHLASPEQLSPPAQTYVVWLQPQGQDPVNAGALKVDDNLNGKLTTRTPYKVFDVFITAENSPTVTAPTGPHVLDAKVDRR